MPSISKTHPRLPEALEKEIRAEPLAAGLRNRILRPCRGVFSDHIHLLIADSGRIELSLGETTTEAEAPVAMILPPSSAINLELSAGTSGWLFGLPPALWADIVGSGPESTLMTPLGDNLILAREFRPNATPSPSVLIQAIEEEIENGQPAAQMAALAYLRLLTLMIWRNARIEPAAPGHGSDLHTLERFRRVVEVNFRKHMTIAEYADILGVTQSRLRRICNRALDRSPIQLVHMRMMREAAAWLQHSGQSVKEIAQAMGFADAAEFSHFFKRNSTMSPRDYRLQLNKGKDQLSDLGSFADWP